MPKRSYYCRIAVSLGVVCWGVASAGAQIAVPTLARGELPGPRYAAVFVNFYRGEYAAAGRDFRSLSKSAYRDGSGIFLDSLCYWTMQAECHFRLGEFVQALELYDQSIRLYLEQSAWDARTQFPPQIAVAASAWQQAGITWGQTGRNATIAAMPNSFPVLFGRFDNDRVLREGGVIQPPELISVNLAEILRCTALAIHRRRTLLGPLAAHDPLTQQMLAGLTNTTRGDGSLPGAWNQVLLGWAQLSADQAGQAYSTFQQAVQFNGSLDHPLTPWALYGMAVAAEAEDQADTAGKLFLEASYSAAVFGQFDLVGQSLAAATTLHLVARAAEPSAVLPLAAQWADRQRADGLTAQLWIEAAKDLAAAQRLDTAREALAQAKRASSGNDIGKTELAVDFNYVAALLGFQAGEGRSATADFAAALKAWQRSAPRVFQLALTDRAVSGGRLAPREADLIYRQLLRDPTPRDWTFDPMGSIGFLLTEHLPSMRLWFDAVMVERKVDAALQIADQIRRHRFYATQPLGGRTLSLRWLLEAPRERLTDAAAGQRDAILQRYPDYTLQSRQSAALLEQLRQMPAILTVGSDEEMQQRKLAEQLLQTAAAQENLISWIALQRDPAEMALAGPDASAAGSDQLPLPDGLVVAFLETTQGMHVFTAQNGAATLESVVNRRQLTKALTDLLKAVGNASDRNAVNLADYPVDKIRAAASAVHQLLFPNRNRDFWSSASELVVIPDGPIWYAPLDLVLADPEALRPLRIRYAPFLSAALPNTIPPPPFPRNVLARVAFPQTELQARIDEQAAQFKAAMPATEEYAQAGKTSSQVLSAVVDRLTVWQDSLRLEPRSVGQWPVMAIDARLAGSRLEDWLLLPWGAPRVLIVPHASTGAAASAVAAPGAGDELFILACDLIAAGVQTGLVSRWNVGPVEGCRVSQAFLAALDGRSAIDAWLAAAESIRALPADIEAGSRLRPPPAEGAPWPPDHPFRWSGYLLIDTGWKPPPEAADPALPAMPEDAADSADGQ